MPWPISRLRIVRVRQHDITDCGAACLHSVAGHYGYRVPLSRIRQLASTDRKGTSVLGLLEAASQLGFLAKGVKGPFESLFKIPKPAIAHVLLNGVLYHYVVIYATTARHIVIMDPGDGQVHRLSHQEFKDQWSGVLLLLIPGETFRPGTETRTPLQRFSQLVQPHRSVMLQALAGAGATTILGLSTAIYVQKIVDHVVPSGNQNLLDLLSLGMLVILVAATLLGWIRDLLILRTGQKIDAALILGYYQHLLRLPQRFFDTMRVGELLSRVNDAVKIRAFINDVAMDLVVNSFVVLFSLVLLFVYSWQLGLLLLVALPLFSLIWFYCNRINRKNERQVMERAAELETHLVESLEAVTTLKHLHGEAYAGLKTEAGFVRLLRRVYRSGTNTVLAGNTTHLLSSLTTIALLWIGTGLTLDQGLSPGTLMSCYALLGYLTTPATSLVMANRTVQEAVIAADRLFEIMDLEIEELKNGSELQLHRLGPIRFENVSFRYGGSLTVFRDLTLEIPQGKVTAITGESGSGKSTLAALLQGLYPVNAGAIRIGDTDLRYISRESLRRVVGIVPQDIHLFAGSVIENIAFGDFEPDFPRVLELCVALGMNEFIEELPSGYHTPLGAHGVGLSGGQRQRIAIARTLYRDPRVLILDEATSSLDPQAEHYVQKLIRTLRDKGRTIIMITHRLQSVKQADRIVVLENGRVTEEGIHSELLTSRNTYYRLWKQHLPGPVSTETELPPLPPPLA